MGGLKEKVDMKHLDETYLDDTSVNVSYCNSLGEKMGKWLVRQMSMESQIYQLLFLDNI